ncbi:DNA-binding transcriptional activator of the SARP family [Thermomonospora echinospora]|uniref:DNA-binding transcriptional activator of the SARP family n=1 Tax=Thermomonospora echinospora TaxID=1992 RepID=A0A1H6DYU6_9ACTN|nr:AfsR/SARP family transcriptional regulator [Thermomonospora echinospora]SEG89993.1 DNA-binding transcriptional activator of the SARP family [Thermomonospora echinospora]
MSVVVRLLGPVDVTVADEVRPVPGLRRKAVLARLALRPGDVVGVDQLIDAVWDGEPPATAVNSLQSHVSYLRRLLGTAEAVMARPPGYVLGALTTDLRLAEELIERGRGPGEPAERLAALEQALALWRGRSLADVAGLPWFEQEAERLERMRRAAEHAALECRLALGRHGELVPELEELAGRHPFDEDLHGQLMIALYRSGRQADALAVFRGLRARLREELGIDPSGPLRDLQAAVLRQDPGLDPVPAAPASGGGGAVLVERAKETGLIERALDEVLRDGEGRVLLFEGPAGIGKTSVLDHARKRAAAMGFTVLTARSTDLETDYAWGCARLLFQRQAPAEEIVPAGAGEYAIINALYRLTGSLASRHPLLISIDDLHWTDAATAQFLAYLATRLDGLRAVLVIGTRPGHERLGRIVSVIAGLPHTVTRTLQPLTRAGCARLLALLTDTEPDADLVDRCHALTRGNPFLLRELAQTGGDPAQPEGSPSVARYVTRQLRYLPAAAVTAARVLAVLGDEVGGGLVAQVARTSPQEALDALAPLVSSQLVTADGVPVRFSFGHPLIRTAVYDAIPEAERTDLHLRAAQVHAHDPIKAATHLVRVPPGLGSLDPVPVLSEAADASLARGSVNGAVAFLRRALEEDLGDRRAGMLTRLGTVESLIDAPRGIEHLAEALALEPDPDRRAQVSFSLATVLWLTCRPREAARVCQASLERDHAASTGTRLALRSCVAMVAYGARNGSDLVALIDDYAARPVDTSTLGGLMLESGLALHDMYQNRRRSAERRALNALEGDRLIGDPAGETMLTCAFYALRACDTPRLMASVDTLFDHSRRSGSLRGLSPALYFRAEYLYIQGRLAESVAHSRQAWETSAYATMGLGEIFVADVHMKALVATGQVQEAAAVLSQVEAAQASGLTPILYSQGEIAIHLARGDTQRAFEVALAARDDCRSRPLVNPLVSDWRAPLIRCLVSLGRMEEARDVAADLLDVATVWDTPRAVGRALRFAASVESGPRRLEMLAESVRLLDLTQATLERARSLHAFGDALRRAGRPEEARARLTAALELAAFCGAGPLQTSIRAALREAGGRTPDSADTTTLTPSDGRPGS